MSSVASTSSGLANLLQTLTQNASPEVSSVLSTPSVQSALEKAPAGDIVQLSAQAMQLQEVGLLFGDSTDGTTATTGDSLLSMLSSSSSSSSSSDSVLAALESAVAQSSATSTGSSATSTGLFQSLQAAEAQALFDGNSSSSSSDPLLNVIG